MNISIIGYGKMGRIIKDIASNRGHTITSIIDPHAEGATHKKLTPGSIAKSHVCIDFSSPDCAIRNIHEITAAGKDIVIGTTGWWNQMDEAVKAVHASGRGLIWSGNFSIGVHIFSQMVRSAARIINTSDSYDIYAYEKHHRNKADSPSGTAEMLGKILTEEITRKKRIQTERPTTKIKEDQIHFASIRGGSLPGTHTIGFDSLYDTIEMTHTARSRDGFAEGAVIAAEFIRERKGIYTIDHLMSEMEGSTWYN